MGSDAVFLAVPSRGQVVTATATALLQPGRHPVYCVRTHACSLLALSFNSLWCMALNERVGPGGRRNFGLFAMLHDDVAPIEPGWLDALVREYRASGADVLSAVVPIKDDRGLTSTAFYHPPTRKMTRLTMQEAANLPPTFDAAAAGHPGCVVLPNTGLWVCDFTRPWVEKVCFTVRDRIHRNPDGAFAPQAFSEDWDFGVQAYRLGLKVMATTAVRLSHQGRFDYPNFVPWGLWKADEQVAVWDPPA